VIIFKKRCRQKYLMTGEYHVSSSHYQRQCHPETCCCDTDYVIVQDQDGCDEIIGDVDSEEQGRTIIGLLNKYPEEFNGRSIQGGLLRVIKKKITKKI
jgi:hypothetical protein